MALVAAVPAIASVVIILVEKDLIDKDLIDKARDSLVQMVDMIKPTTTAPDNAAAPPPGATFLDKMMGAPRAFLEQGKAAVEEVGKKGKAGC